MNAKPLDELYFIWLYRQVANPDVADPAFTYWKLLKELYTKEFVWLVPNDDNRIVDGKELRVEFIQDEGLTEVDLDWIELGCSMFELMVGLSRRLSFEAEGEPHYWFWNMMENIGLQKYSDERRLARIHINKVLDRVIFRTYDPDGRGGLFPLNHSTQDQRNVELWYQLSAYVLEQSE
jgi:hypothetical protein